MKQEIEISIVYGVKCSRYENIIKVQKYNEDTGEPYITEVMDGINLIPIGSKEGIFVKYIYNCNDYIHINFNEYSAKLHMDYHDDYYWDPYYCIMGFEIYRERNDESFAINFNLEELENITKSKQLLLEKFPGCDPQFYILTKFLK